MRKIGKAVAAVGLAVALALGGCTEADKVSHNVRQVLLDAR
jgi:outer membrane lipoprotein SlyB